ncbi:GlcNAc-transferase family protein [Tepidamorphus sp. 3E244]|uniref:GlcNAc-transferase family protein n=1 Tax=Tepidamorphus sp. 3E244 TaxID=3385498 RepID=UPI0038FBF02E
MRAQADTPGIFVQIASYRDPQLVPTLRDCVAKAAHADKLTFGICWQRDESESLEEFAGDPRVRVVELDYRDSRGTCWARHQIQQLYAGETYTLQIDSHHRFVEGWDTLLVSMMGQTGSAKPVISCYAPGFDPFDPAEPFAETPWELGFDRFTPEGVLFMRPREMEGWKALTRPIPGRYFSGHFAFAPGSFCRDVPYDPNLYFHGEEITIAVRAFTHGYDLFCPHRVVLWHEYTRKYRTKHWDDHVPEKGAEIPWTVRNDHSLLRNRILLGMEEGDVDFGPYGFGTERTLRDYEDYAGINFRLRLVQPYTYENRPPPNPEIYTSDEEWQSRATKEFWTRIRFENGFPDPDPDVDFWYVGVHDADGNEMHRADIPAKELGRILAQDRAEFIHQYRAYRKAENWTVWPHSKDRGWLEKFTGRLTG